MNWIRFTMSVTYIDRSICLSISLCWFGFAYIDKVSFESRGIGGGQLVAQRTHSSQQSVISGYFACFHCVEELQQNLDSYRQHGY